MILIILILIISTTQITGITILALTLPHFYLIPSPFPSNLPIGSCLIIVSDSRILANL